jgi:hypothetical protein
VNTRTTGNNLHNYNAKTHSMVLETPIPIMQKARHVRKGNRNSRSIPMLNTLIERLGNTLKCALLNAAVKPVDYLHFFPY